MVLDGGNAMVLLCYGDLLGGQSVGEGGKESELITVALGNMWCRYRWYIGIV